MNKQDPVFAWKQARTGAAAKTTAEVSEAASAKRGRGRPTRAASGTHDAKVLIREEARRQFGARGYRGTTLRSVADAAGVDPRLVLHYFGSKRELFLDSVELPIDPDQVVNGVFAAGLDEVPRRAVALILSTLEDAARRDAFIGILRAAVSEPEVADMIGTLLAERMLTPIASRVGGARPELRASMVASQVLGLGIARYVVRLEPLASAPADELARAITPVVEHYLRGDWVTLEEARIED